MNTRYGIAATVGNTQVFLYNTDNTTIPDECLTEYDCIFGDCIYESHDFYWVEKYWELLKESGIFVVMTDHHTVFEYGVLLCNLPGAKFVNHVVWKNEWGRPPSDRLSPCFDDIIIVSKGNHKFDKDKAQIPKVTVSKGLNPSGRDTKIATAFISDICLTTTSKERIRKDDGHLVEWQKPVELLNRVLNPFVSRGSSICDPFMGSGTAMVWAVNNKMNIYTGIEIDPDKYKLACNRMEAKSKEY